MIELTEEQWARIVAMLPKMKAEKAKKDKAEAVKADAKEERQGQGVDR